MPVRQPGRFLHGLSCLWTRLSKKGTLVDKEEYARYDDTHPFVSPTDRYETGERRLMRDYLGQSPHKNLVDLCCGTGRSAWLWRIMKNVSAPST